MTFAIISATRTGNRIRTADALANVLLLAALWACYAAVRGITDNTHHAAVRNAQRLLDAEAAIGIDIELAAQATVPWPAVFVAANSYYLAHFPLTLIVLVIAFGRRREDLFVRLRNSLIGVTTVALIVHLVVPMAPPRMLAGFVDAGSTYGPDPYAVAGSESANQFAAMPSMHVAWAVLTGFAVWHLSTHRLTRALGVLHPLVTTLVVLLTAHHFVSDAIIGAALACGLLGLTTRCRIDRTTITEPRNGHPTPTTQAAGLS